MTFSKLDPTIAIAENGGGFNQSFILMTMSVYCYMIAMAVFQSSENDDVRASANGSGANSAAASATAARDASDEGVSGNGSGNDDLKCIFSGFSRLVLGVECWVLGVGFEFGTCIGVCCGIWCCNLVLEVENDRETKRGHK